MKGKCFHSVYRCQDKERWLDNDHTWASNDISRTNPFHSSEIYFIPVLNSKTPLPLCNFRQ